MHAADGGPDQPQASPGQTGNAGALAANCVSDQRTQPWRVRRKPGSQPKVRPGTVAADLSPWPRARRLLYVPEAEGTNPAPQDSFGKAREAVPFSRETLKGGQRGRGTQRTTNFRALCSLPRKWRQSSLLPVPCSTSLGLGFHTPM